MGEGPEVLGRTSAACNIPEHDRLGSRSMMVWRGFSLDGYSYLVRIILLDTRITVRPHTGARSPGFLLLEQSDDLIQVWEEISPKTIHQHHHHEQAQMMYNFRTSIWRSHTLLNYTAELF